MHICMIVGEFPPFCGGIGNYVYNLSKFLLKNGYNVTVLTRGNAQDNIFHTHFENIEVWMIRFLPIYPYHIKVHGYFLNKILSKYQTRFDIVHAHSPLIPSPVTTLPVIVTEHGTVSGDISNSSITDIQSFAQKIFAKRLIKYDYESLINADVVTAVSNSCMQEIKSMIGDKKQINILGNGVDAEYFKPDEKIDRSQNIVLYTGRLDSRKGIGDLIKSAKYICKNDPDIKFIITGKGPNKEYIQKYINNMNLRGNITLTGFVSKTELLRLYQSSTIYVLPSYYEGLPTTLLEAMSCGLPSIATDIESISEVISHGKTGILVPPRNTKELCINIQNLLDDEQKRKDIGNNGRNYVIKNHNWAKIAAVTAAMYDSMV